MGDAICFVTFQYELKGSVPFKGLVIAQLSDIHLGPTSGLSRLEKIVQLTNSIGITDKDVT